MKIYDRMYREMKFPQIIYDLLDCPGLLRLKDVRMANNPFVAFPSFSTASRYEHSLGVCYLAGICADHLRLNQKDKLELMIAALYHDVGTPPFAHAMEEVLQVHFHFDHEVNLSNLIIGKTDNFDGELAQIYQGASLKLRSVCQQDYAVKLGIDISRIAKLAVGSPDEVLSPLLNSKGMDLDNIDNVFRASTAMGIINTDGGEIAKKLAKAFVVTDGVVQYNWDKYSDEISYWQAVRNLQYTSIFESIEDFAYQTMIKKAINILSIEDGSDTKLDQYSWRMTDSVFTNQYLLRHAKSKDIMQRVLLCKPYTCIAVLYLSGKNTSKFVNSNLDEIETIASKFYDSIVFPEKCVREANRASGDSVLRSIVANFYPDKRKRTVDKVAVSGGEKVSDESKESTDGALLGLFTPYTANGYSTVQGDSGEKRRIKTAFRKENLDQLIDCLNKIIFHDYKLSVYRSDSDAKFAEDTETSQLGLF